jgi:hypothetical protein
MPPPSGMTVVVRIECRTPWKRVSDSPDTRGDPRREGVFRETRVELDSQESLSGTRADHSWRRHDFDALSGDRCG